MTATLVDTMVSRWSDPAARPLFKGSLIDKDGCCCAQGDVLRMCGWSDKRLRSVDQKEADRAVATALGISVTHAVLLRQVNDRADGCPQDVLAHPERILGDQADRVLAFWRYLDHLTPKQRTAAWTATETAIVTAAYAAASTAAWTAAWTAAREAIVTAREATVVAMGAALLAYRATDEIQGAAHLKSFFFLPMFGIADPSELDRDIEVLTDEIP